MLVGPNARLVLPLSAIGGAILMVVADLVARMLGELPVGVITAVIGAPFFLLLLRRAQRGLRAVSRADPRAPRRVRRLRRADRCSDDVDLDDRARRVGRDRRPERGGQVDAPPADHRPPAPSPGAIVVEGGRWRGWTATRSPAGSPSCPQPSSLPFSASVEAVVALGRLPHEDRFRGLRPADRAAVAAAIERVGLGRLVGRDVRELSLGERQLVLLAVAIAQAAPIVLLDEPTVHLDIRHQFDVMDLLADLNRRDGRTVVTVLHDLHLAARRIPRIVVVADGRVVADGPPAEALDGERIRDVFGVEPELLPDGPWTAPAAELRRG